MLGIILLLQAVTIAVSGPPTPTEYLPLRVALGEGYFAEEGLDVKLLTTRAESGAAESLAQATADLAATSVEAALRFGTVKEGRVPRIVYGLTAAPPVVLAVTARSKSTVRSVGDLAGNTVGISSPGAPEQTWLLGLLERVDLRVPQVGLVSYGERGLGVALAAGDVGIGLIGDPVATRLLEDGTVTALADLRDHQGIARAFGRSMVHAAIFETGTRRLGHGILESLCRALLRAVSRVETAAPADLSAHLPPSVVGLADDFAIRLRSARHIYLPNGSVEPDALDATIAMVRAHVPLRRTPRIPRASEMLRLEPLRQALSPARAR